MKWFKGSGGRMHIPDFSIIKGRYSSIVDCVMFFSVSNEETSFFSPGIQFQSSAMLTVGLYRWLVHHFSEWNVSTFHLIIYPLLSICWWVSCSWRFWKELVNGPCVQVSLSNSYWKGHHEVWYRHLSGGHQKQTGTWRKPFFAARIDDDIICIKTDIAVPSWNFFLYRIKNRGPNVDPRGTPLSTISGFGLKLSLTTV